MRGVAAAVAGDQEAGVGGRGMMTGEPNDTQRGSEKKNWTPQEINMKKKKTVKLPLFYIYI